MRRLITTSCLWLLALAMATAKVTLTYYGDRSCTMTNGLITVSIARNGSVTSIKTAGGVEVFDNGNDTGRGYFDFVTDNIDYAELAANKSVIVNQTDQLAEVAYYNDERTMQWRVGYIMRDGISGLYTYAQLKNTATAPDGVREARMVWRVNPSLFNYAYVGDGQQGTMPTVAQMKDYVKELQDATYELEDGTVYTKYDWANFVKDDQLHGIMGTDIGAWVITPSMEWVNGGCDKQDLTVHATDKTPVMLEMVHSNHFGAVTATFDEGAGKLYGPYLLYINNGTHEEMVTDAKAQATQETEAWPYDWFSNTLFPNADQRATVTGRIRLDDSFGTSRLRVMLGEPDVKPALQGTGYQFATETDADGNFTIGSVRPGTYALYAWALNGTATGMLETGSISITEGSNTLGDITWSPVRYASTLFCLGDADRTTAGFCESDHVRQYGLWNEAPADKKFTIGEDDPQTDWYYTQSKEGTWTIKFKTDELFSTPLHLTIATAGAAGGVKLEVKANTTLIGSVGYVNDGSVYRSATLAGRDSIQVFEIPANALHKGVNNLHLKLWNLPSSGLGGILYDCIKLEAGDVTTAITAIPDASARQTGDEVYDLQGRKAKTFTGKGIYIRNGRKFLRK